MEILAALTGWLLASFPLALLLGRLLGGARLLSEEMEQPSTRGRRAA